LKSYIPSHCQAIGLKTKIALSNLGLEKEPTNILNTFSPRTQNFALAKAKYQQSKTALTIQSQSKNTKAVDRQGKAAHQDKRATPVKYQGDII
jgi:hypothetical protein